MIADAASSIGIVIVAFIIMSTGIVILDPIVSLGISAVIFYWSWGILRDSTRILLVMAPKGMNIEAITEDLKNYFPQIIEVDDAHLWMVIPDMLLYSAHIRLKEEKIETNHQDLIISINEFLSDKYKILESTIQILPKDAIMSCNF